jgi:hypothetical protein
MAQSGMASRSTVSRLRRRKDQEKMISAATAAPLYL